MPTLSDDSDTFRWKLASNGSYSASTAYLGFFLGSTAADYAKLLWSSWVPLKEKLFMWLALRNRCWTGDRLSRKGLPGPDKCLLCDQQVESMDHLMIHCPTSRSIWFEVLVDKGFGGFVPQQNQSLREWWNSLTNCQPKDRRKELASLAIAGCRRLWLERNNRNFERKQETEEAIIRKIREEFTLWQLARQKAGNSEE